LHGGGLSESVLQEVGLEYGGESEFCESFHLSSVEGNQRTNYQRGEKRGGSTSITSKSIAQNGVGWRVVGRWGFRVGGRPRLERRWHRDCGPGQSPTGREGEDASTRK
jgi:hypothetical protein